MIPDYLISIFRIVLVAVLLLGMIALLMGINHLTHNDDVITPAETDRLKKDLRESQRVITSRSVFHKFLARESTRGETKRN